MVQRSKQYVLVIGALMACLTVEPVMAQPMQFIRHQAGRSEQSQPRPMVLAASGDCRGLHGWDRRRCEDRRSRERREHARRERERREDAKKKGIVTGVVGAVIGAAVIGAIAGGAKKNKEASQRRRYCLERYGNYDQRTDSYRASDGRFYPCE